MNSLALVLLGEVKDLLKKILFGATVYDVSYSDLRMKSHVEQALILVLIGDILSTECGRVSPPC